MKFLLVIALLLLLPLIAFAQSQSRKSDSKSSNQKRFEIHTKPFVDLHFYVYKLAASGEKPPVIDGFQQAIEAARQVPMSRTFIDLALFDCDNAADAERAFSLFPETFKTREGTVLPLREPAIHLARSLAVIEKAFREKIWPKHRDTIQR